MSWRCAVAPRNPCHSGPSDYSSPVSIYQFRAGVTVAGATHDVILLYDGSGPDTGDGGGWMIDMPTVLSLVAACETATINPGGLRGALQQMMATFRERSGCCPRCDEATDSYARTLSEYEEAGAREKQKRRRSPQSRTPIS